MARPPITRAHPYRPKAGALAGQTFHSERQYRNALARRRGFRSWHAQQRAFRDIRGAKQWTKLRHEEKAARDRALEALSLMRRERLSLTQAAKQAGTTLNTALRYAGATLTRGPTGRIVAKPADRLFRRMRVLTPEGPKEVNVRGSRAASLLGGYWSAVQRFIETGDDSALRPFAGKAVGGQRFETDVDAIERWARAGVLEFEDIYDLTA